MKKIAFLGTAMVAGLLVLGGVFATQTNAMSIQADQSVTVAEGETLYGSLFTAGQDILVEGDVEGDVFCAGQTITITGTVDGDVLCAGSTVTITGDVTGDVRLAAQTITIDGAVSKSASIAGQSVVLSDAGSIGRDAQIGAQTVTLNGSVGRDLAVGGENVTLNGFIGRDVNAELMDLTVGNGAVIAGNLAYTGPTEIAIDGQVDGATTWTEKAYQKNSYQWTAADSWRVAFFVFLSVLTCAMLLIALFPRRVHEASSFIVDDWTKTLLIGFVAVALVPAGLFLLMLTGIGFGASLAIGIAWLALMTLAAPVSMYAVGRLVMQKVTNNAALYMLVGVTIVLIALCIPLIGLLTWIAMIWFGIGAVLRAIGFEKPVYTMKPAKKKK